MDQTRIRPTQHQLRVVRATDLTSSMRRVTLHAPTLTALPLRPAQDVGLVLRDDSGRQVRRRYTIRNADATSQTIELDGILHGHGPGARWFAGAHALDVVDVVGPRGKIEITPADWYLFVGDESGLPAFTELAAILPAAATACVIVEIADASEQLPVPSAADVELSWVHRNGTPNGTSDLLVTAFRSARLPAGIGRAYLLGESRAVVALRPVLAERGLVGPQVFLKGYWNSPPGR